MHIAVFGATGGTGRNIVNQALAAGHDVKVLVRDAEKLQIAHSHLTIIVGNVLDPIKVRETIEGTESVAVSLGTTSNNPDDVVAQGTQNVIDAMQSVGVQRLVIVSSLGIGDSRELVGLLFKTMMETVLKKAIEDKENQEAAVRASGLEWVILRPAGLTNDDKISKVTLTTDGSTHSERISRASVAAAVLNQLTTTTPMAGRAVLMQVED